MEIFVSAVMGELAKRSITFFVNKYSSQPMQDVAVSLERILLRAQVIINEAARRRITNQGMLCQLSMLRDAMYQGIYVLDTFRYRATKEDEARDHQAVSHSWALSKNYHAKHLCRSSSSNTKTLQELEEILGGLTAMIHDASEMVMFLSSYPCLHRQPYIMHLLLEKCMFAHQMEVELVSNFLLHTKACSSSVDRFDVLPIVSPERVGKSTLIAHVCENERVRDHFSQIVFFRHGNFRSEDIATLRDTCAVRHENNGRLLVVVDIVGDLDEDLWEKLCSLCRQCTTSGSKITITCRSDKIMKLGTTQTLTLKHMSDKAYWYFFKMITFEGEDPNMHPRLAYLAMEIARNLNGNLVTANFTARVLRANFSIQFWCKILKLLRGHLPMFKVDRPTNLQRMGRTTGCLRILGQYQTCSSEEEVPKIKFQDVMNGTITPHGTFKALTWKSQIPPYHFYIYTCEIQEVQARVAKRKRSLNKSCVTSG